MSLRYPPDTVLRTANLNISAGTYPSRPTNARSQSLTAFASRYATSPHNHKNTLKMASTTERVYLNDSESQVREKLNMQGKEKDEDFSKFVVRLPLFSMNFG